LNPDEGHCAGDIDWQTDCFDRELRGGFRLSAILEAWPLYGVGLGLEDMFSDIDLVPTQAADLSRHVKLRLVVEAKARGLVAIDTVSLEYRNRESRAARRVPCLGSMACLASIRTRSKRSMPLFRLARIISSGLARSPA
jgi:hypothetical protein